MTLARADFADFFEAVRVEDQRPFLWQERLLDHLLEHGRWPDRINAPTGAGKTAVVDVHVFACALSAAGLAPRLPRRLVLVVARRAVVDSHDEHARHVAARLSSGAAGVLAEVAAQLDGLREADGGGQATALVTARLRGGAPPPKGWRDDVEACAVITGTPEMIGSRLLLHGYGSSPRAWPREAGLLAVDSVMVVDEAHLSRQLLYTARRVGELVRVGSDGGALLGAVPGLQVVETTATPAVADKGSEVGVRFSDLEDSPTLRARLTRAKPLELLELSTWPLPSSGPARASAFKALADAVLRAYADLGGTVGCVVNRVATAVDLAGELEARGLVVETLVGRLRPADVAHLRRRRPGLLSIDGNKEVDVLVATQTVEVGVDLDLKALITELAPGAALAQRAGRVNRLGNRMQTRVVVAVPSAGVPKEGTAPYGQDELRSSLSWLRDRAQHPAGLAPWALLAAPPPGAAARRTLYQRVDVADSWAWARTGDEQFAEPDLALWLHDELSQDSDVGVVLRHDLPVESADAEQLLRLLPPRPHETFTVSIGVARGLLDSLRKAADAASRAPQPTTRPAVLQVRQGEVRALLTDDPASWSALRPGDVFVLDDCTPVLRGGVVVSDAQAPHVEKGRDVYEHAVRSLTGTTTAVAGHASLRLGRSSRLRHGDAALMPEVEALARSVSEANWTLAQKATLAEVLQAAAVGGSWRPEEDLSGVLEATVDLLQKGQAKDCEVVVDKDDSGRPVRVVVVDRRRALADEDVRQTWTSSVKPVPLAQHQENVGRVASQLARRLGLPGDVTRMLRLAGDHHDDGKADARFQVVLGRVDADPVLAKSGRQSLRQRADAVSASGLPMGWRHEQLSALRAWQVTGEGRAEDRLLVTRLVGTTHGHGRPSFPHGARSLLGAEPDPEAAALFDEGQWERLVGRTDRRHGVWALAYLEALLRAADGRVSRAGS